MRKCRIYMEKPTLVGEAMLEKSKELMYSFFYDYIKPKFGSRAQLLYMDTDRFILSIQTDDFFDDTKDDLKEWFDTSGYDKNMILPDVFKQNTSMNKKVIGKMEDEIGKGYMTEFVALSPKRYAYQQINIDDTLSEEKKAKGTNKMVTKKSLAFEHYKKCLFNNQTVKCIQYRIESTSRSVNTVIMTKIAFKKY